MDDMKDCGNEAYKLKGYNLKRDDLKRDGFKRDNFKRDYLKRYSLKRCNLREYILARHTSLRIVGTAAGVIALVWWCVLYPELCFPQDTFEVVYEAQDIAQDADTEGMEVEDGAEGIEAYPHILQADDGQIVVKSRLFEWLRLKNQRFFNREFVLTPSASDTNIAGY